MPKLRTEFPEQINILCRTGITAKLRAIAYYRGEKGRYAGPAKDFIADGIDRWIASLGPAERKRFDSILSTVQDTSALHD